MFIRNSPCFFSSCCRMPMPPASPPSALLLSISLFTPPCSVSHARTARCARTSGGSGTVSGLRKSSARVRLAWMMALRCVFCGCSNIMSPMRDGGRSRHGVTSTVCMKKRAGSLRRVGSAVGAAPAPGGMIGRDPKFGALATHTILQKSYSCPHSFLSSARASMGVTYTWRPACCDADAGAALAAGFFFFSAAAAVVFVFASAAPSPVSSPASSPASSESESES
mmetsp:Transcript_29342/g.73242  ORF Transcript_29342/g.73242 Transcript_29342/m.73242 type:complete len:224 (-) Transcript_29342:1264-1935(-)